MREFCLGGSLTDDTLLTVCSIAFLSNGPGFGSGKERKKGRRLFFQCYAHRRKQEKQVYAFPLSKGRGIYGIYRLFSLLFAPLRVGRQKLLLSF